MMNSGEKDSVVELFNHWLYLIENWEAFNTPLVEDPANRQAGKRRHDGGLPTVTETGTLAPVEGQYLAPLRLAL